MTISLRSGIDVATDLTEASACAPVPGGTMYSAVPKKVWIDLDNSPHVPFFAPIIEALEKRGHTALLTARDFAQVCELADRMHLRYVKVGRHFGKNMAVKLLGLATRAVQLARIVRPAKADIAVSHGSRSQLLLANLLGIPAITIGDYEHARVFAGIRPRWVIVPQVFPTNVWGMSQECVLKYPGIKEDVYVSRFRPDAGILRELEIGPTDIVVTVRPPATHAHYHVPESETIFERVMDRLGATENVRCILLPRTPQQKAEIRRRWKRLFDSGKAVIPARALDGLNLIWYSDLVISGGGTMNREAAALKVPVYSTFRGKIGVVDTYLVNEGRLVLIESVKDVDEKLAFVRRRRGEVPECDDATLQAIVGHIEHVMEAECRKPAP